MRVEEIALNKYEVRDTFREVVKEQIKISVTVEDNVI